MKLKSHISHVWTGGKACRTFVRADDAKLGDDAPTQAMVCKRPGNSKLWCVDVMNPAVRQTDSMRCRQGMKGAMTLAHELFQDLPEGGVA